MSHRSCRRRPSSPIAATWIAAISLLAAASRPAAAQNADAEALFEEAVRLEEADRIDEACDAYEGSNRIEPRAGTLIRLGQCREIQGRLASAWSAYKDARARARDPRKRELAEARIAELEPRLSYLTVSVPDESRIDGLEIRRNGVLLDAALWNRATPVDGGPYVISGRAPGHEEWSATVTVAAERERAAVEVPRFKVLRTLVVEPPADQTPAPPPRSGLTMRRTLALGAGGIGVVAVAAGGLLGLSARGLAADASDLCPEPDSCMFASQARAYQERAGARALQANVALGAGAAALITATILWFTGAPSDVAIAPRLGADHQGVDVAWRF
jgi:tetratricopeptide (TPR) repeat protein